MNILQSYNETEEQRQVRENRLKIAEYKHRLAETDYAAIKIGEGAATADEYADVLENRRYWRSEINLLETINDDITC